MFGNELRENRRAYWRRNDLCQPISYPTYMYIEKLTPDVLNDMVKSVYVHAPDKSSGHRVQGVDISYNHIGILPANLLYDIMDGKAA